MKYSSFSKKNKTSGKTTGRYPRAAAEKQPSAQKEPGSFKSAFQPEEPTSSDSQEAVTAHSANPSNDAPGQAQGASMPEGAALEERVRAADNSEAVNSIKAETKKRAFPTGSSADETETKKHALQAGSSPAETEAKKRALQAGSSPAETEAKKRALQADNFKGSKTNEADADRQAAPDKNPLPEEEQSDESDLVDMRAQKAQRPQRKKSKPISAKENLIFLTACIAVIAAILVISIKDSSRTGAASPGITQPDGLSSMTPPGAWANPTPTGPPLISEPSGMIIMDNSVNAKQIMVEEKRINRPAVYGSELLFSAGNGSIEKPVLTTLYLFDVTTQKYTKIATTQIEDGEIFEYFLSDKWIIWLDTDHKGTNIIYKMNRQSGDITKVREVGNLRPKLSLYGDLLAWMEQIDEESDRLYLLELNSEEDIVIEEFHETAYALSAPYIYQNTVLWVGEDPSGSGNSAIFRADFKMDDNYNPEDQEQGAEDSPSAGSTSAPSASLENTSASSPTPGNTPALPEGPWLALPSSSENETLKVYYYPAGMYVHEPMYNGEVIIWIDKNKAPDSSLYMLDLSTNEVPLLQTGVTSYALGTDFVVINSNQEIWAYYYKANTLMRVSSAERASILPETQGRVIVWEDKSSSGSGDVFMYNILG